MTFLVIEIHDSRQLGKVRIELGNRVSPIGNIAFVAVVAQLGHDDGFAEADYQIVTRLQYFAKGTVTAEFTFVVFLKTEHRKSYHIGICIARVVVSEVAVPPWRPHVFCLDGDRVAEVVKSAVRSDIVRRLPSAPRKPASRILHLLPPPDCHRTL